ncbi:hypothetical protein B0U03_02280 [Listeria monocytogenes]|nr:hypothetical protein [Listeria monocytogenes]EAE9689108.1 hypothetical protein [Listeria monocytogenes]EAE9692169.1 hypothetical protein [Listeria monocytogenes]EAE9694119.1 hypothetical protein [Listeria monocytogenes]EAE9697668.1 hypothetical protein [Listeria monocytogenes]
MKKTLERWEYELYIKHLDEVRIKLSDSYDELAEDKDFGVNKGAYMEFHEYIEDALDSIDDAYAILRTLKPEELEEAE